MADILATLDAARRFDRARQQMLAEFRELIAVSPEIAVREAEATLSAMRQIFQLETAHG